jgi:hypothetical protein
MRKGLCLFASVLLTTAGCWPQILVPDKSTTPPVVQFSPRPAPPRTLVTPEQVDDRNAREMVQLLQQELEMDEQDAALTPPATPAPPLK